MLSPYVSLWCTKTYIIMYTRHFKGRNCDQTRITVPGLQYSLRQSLETMTVSGNTRIFGDEYYNGDTTDEEDFLDDADDDLSNRDVVRDFVSNKVKNHVYSAVQESENEENQESKNDNNDEQIQSH